MRIATFAALWLPLTAFCLCADAPMPTKAAPPAPPPVVAPEPPVAVLPAEPYDALRLPFWTDDFIEQWVPSDVPRGHWAYPWMSWMAEEGIFREIFPVEEYGHPDPPREYRDAPAIAGVDELLQSVDRLTDQGIVVGRSGEVYEPKAPALRFELGLVACRAALMLRDAHDRLIAVHPPGPAAPPVNMEAPASRYELAEALIRVARLIGPMDARLKELLDGPTEMGGLPPDVPSSHRFAPAAHAAWSLGLMRGYPDGLFHGSETATRAQVAIAFSRLLDLLEAWPVAGQ